MPDIPILLWPELARTGSEVTLTGDDHHHLCRVLRLRRGDSLELRDGRGAIAAASIAAADRGSATLTVAAAERPPLPDQAILHLALPLLKGKRLDWVIEKGTELGVAGFRLFIGRHSVVKRGKAPERYRELIASAFCQSRRLLLPELREPQPFAALLAEARAEKLDLAWADEHLAGQPGDAVAVAVAERGTLAWIGPEGGFAEVEREALIASGAAALSLGPQRLRSETAALALACRFLLPSPEGGSRPGSLR